MAGRGTGSVWGSGVLKRHSLRWSDMLGRSLKRHLVTALKAVLNLHTYDRTTQVDSCNNMDLLSHWFSKEFFSSDTNK